MKIFRNPLAIGFSAFLPFLFATLIFMKPHLMTIAKMGKPEISNGSVFPHRTVSAGNPEPWVTMDSEKMVQIPDPLKNTLVSLDTTAILVLQNEKIIHETYFLDGAVDKPSLTFSSSKSIVGLLAAIAADQGFLNYEDSALNYLPEWNGKIAPEVKVKHFLEMSSGLNWNENYNNPFSATAEMYYGNNLAKVLWPLRSVREPGQDFYYSSADTQFLGLIVSRAARMPLSDFASRFLWQKIGAEKDAFWSLDFPNGQEKAYCCFNTTARDLARIGQLVLNRGAWKQTKLVSESAIKSLTSPKIVPYYGQQWWIEQGSSGPIPYARGILGQFLIVVPHKNTVIVRLGHQRGPKVDNSFKEVKQLIQWAESL